MIRQSNFYPILNMLDAIQKKYKKGYCYPSQAHQIALLKTFHDTCFSTRTLNRYHAILEDLGFVERQRRIRRLPDGMLQFQTTLYVLTRKAYKFLGRLIRQLSHHTKKVSNWLIQKKSPSISVEIPGPDEGKLLMREEVAALARGLLKDIG